MMINALLTFYYVLSAHSFFWICYAMLAMCIQKQSITLSYFESCEVVLWMQLYNLDWSAINARGILSMKQCKGILG